MFLSVEYWVFLEHQFDVSASDHSTMNEGSGFEKSSLLRKKPFFILSHLCYQSIYRYQQEIEGMESLGSISKLLLVKSLYLLAHS